MNRSYIILTVFSLCGISSSLHAMDPARLDPQFNQVLDDCDRCKHLNYICRDCQELQQLAFETAAQALQKGSSRSRQKEQLARAHSLPITRSAQLGSGISLPDPEKPTQHATIGPRGGPQMPLVMPGMSLHLPASPDTSATNPQNP